MSYEQKVIVVALLKIAIRIPFIFAIESKKRGTANTVTIVGRAITKRGAIQKRGSKTI